MINFANTTVLSYTHSPQFLGDNFNYAVTKNLTIEGKLLNLTNVEGASGINTAISTILSGVNDYDSVIVNNVNLGQGKILSFDFDEDTSSKDVQYKTYRVNLEIYSSGNLFNAFSGYYSGLQWNNSQLINRFQESFSYSRKEDNSSQYSQDVSVRFNSGQNLPDTPMNLAKVFASGFLNSLNLTGFLGASYNKGYKRFYTETYNLIDSSVTYKTNSEFPAESGNYAVTYQHELELGLDGITTVSEKGTIQGLYDPIYISLQSGIALELPQSFGRCSGIFNTYVPNGAYPLNINPINKNIDINKFEGIASFNVKYTNDPKYVTYYIWEYTTTTDVNANRVYTITEQGKVEGIGRRLVDKYMNASGGYMIVESGIANRVGSLYSGIDPYPLTLNLISKSEGFSHYEGQITYSQVFSDDTSLFPASGIRQFELKISDNIPVQAVNKFNILNVKELIQPTNQSTLGQRDISVKMIGNRNLPVSGYLNYATGQLAPYKDLGIDIWTSAADYSYDPLENTFGLKVVYQYDGDYKNFTDIIFNASGVSF